MNPVIRNTEQFQELINADKGVMVYFYSNFCAPCLILRPKVETMMETVFPLMKIVFINALFYPELAAEYGVFSSPSLLVYFEGKETIRESKNVSLNELQQKIERYYAMVFEI